MAMAPTETSLFRKYRKPLLIGFFVTLALAFLLGAFVQPPKPQFIPGPVPRGNYPNVHYPFLSAQPFSDGLTWIWTNPATNEVKMWVINVDTGNFLGELKNVDPLAIDARAGQVFCQWLPPPPNPFVEAFFNRLRQTFGLKLDPATRESYWLLDLNTGKAAFLGHTPDPQMPSSAVPSPAFSRAYLLDIHKPDGTEVFHFDLVAKKIGRLKLPGWPLGWWSDTDILYKLDAGGLGVFNAASGASEMVFTADYLESWLKEHAIQLEPQKVAAFPVWNGQSYDFYATDTHAKWLAATSFLARVDKQEKKLVLLDKEFKFGWSDHLHPSGKFYIYSGRTTGSGSSAIFLRTLPGGEDSTLLPRDPNESYFSLANFSGDSVIFKRSNSLWKINLKGSNTVRLFPPP